MTGLPNTDAVVVEEVKLPEFDLSPELVKEVEDAVLASNEGKTKEQLSEAIEAAKATRLAELSEAERPTMLKVMELRKIAENANKTDEELLELAYAEIDKGTEGSGDPAKVLGESFFGSAKDPAQLTPQGTPSPSAEFRVPEADKPLWDEFQAAKADPVFSAFLEYKRNGGQDFVEMMASTNVMVDPKQLSHDQLKQYSLNQLRLADPSITDEDIEERMEVFTSKSKVEKAEEVLAVRAQLEQQRVELKKQFQGVVTSKASASKESSVKAIQEAEIELNRVKAGKMYYGLELSDGVTNGIMNKLRQEGIGFTLPDGSPDVKRAVRVSLLESHAIDMLQAAFDEGARKAYRKEAIKRSKPLSGLTVRGGIPKPVTRDVNKEVSDLIRQRVSPAKA